jgi:hypothetical protein
VTRSFADLTLDQAIVGQGAKGDRYRLDVFPASRQANDAVDPV